MFGLSNAAKDSYTPGQIAKSGIVCDEQKVQFRTRPYCITEGCEKTGTVIQCINLQLRAVLEHNQSVCPAGSELGSHRIICYDEEETARTSCAPGDRPHTPFEVEPYCAPERMEDSAFVPLRHTDNVPLCGAKPCFTLGRLRRRCQFGTVEGKRRYACNVAADVSECEFGTSKISINPYCYPHKPAFDYSPYCGVGDCVPADAETNQCPSGMRLGPIRSYCGEAECAPEAIIQVRPYCEPVGEAPSYLVDSNGSSYCGAVKVACAVPDEQTGECPAGTRRGNMTSVCDPRLAKSRPIIQPYCVTETEESVLFDSNGIALCGNEREPCSTPDASTKKCPDGKKLGQPQAINQNVFNEADPPKFTIRLLVRPHCMYKPIHANFGATATSDDDAFCSKASECVLLNSVLDACPPGMFRDYSDTRIWVDPSAPECPEGSYGTPPDCIQETPIFQGGPIDVNAIDPNALKSLIG